MKKWMPIIVSASVIAAGCTGVALLFAGCASQKGAVTPLAVSTQGMAMQNKVARLGAPAAAGEVWIVARERHSENREAEQAGSGALMTEINGKEILVPLKHTAVRGKVEGFVGTVEVSQQFQNPFSSKIEAVYVFPLPHDADVNEFVMTIGERRIRGIIREREEAERIYAEAKEQGYVASLLTEERPNIFRQSIANIDPGKEISVDLKYFHTLAYVDGWFEFVFPMVVGPRFNPEGSSGGPGSDGEGTDGNYLKPGERTKHDVDLTVDIEAGVPIEEFECRTHEIEHESVSPEHLRVSLAAGDKLPNRDFVLRYRIAGEQIKSSLVTHQDERGGFFSLTLYPPRELNSLRRQPLELVFVIDCSGSMDGRPIQQAKAAVQRALQLLQPEDSFQLITFSMRASSFGGRPLAATPANIRRAIDYLQSLRGEGGTMMLEGIKAALEFPHDAERLRFVCFLTDGYIGNESEILGEVHKSLGDSRIFSFGIGSSVNRYLIEELGKVGRGAVAFLGPADEAKKIMEDFFERISHPAMTEIAINWGTLNPLEVYPRRIPDLFVGRPVMLVGRCGETGNTAVHVSGVAAGERVGLAVPEASRSIPRSSDALPKIWARMKIAELLDEATYVARPSLGREIRDVALEYGLMSDFTSFIAVDASGRTVGSEARTFPVPVPVPSGVSDQTTTEER